MMKNGFAFVESIVAIVILTSSLLLLYSSFHRLLQIEKTRAYYDDINYIYRSEYIKDNLNELNLSRLLNDLNGNDERLFTTIGIETASLFNGYEDRKNFVQTMLNDLEVKEMLIVKKSSLDALKKCTVSCKNGVNCDTDGCNNLYLNVSSDMINYIRTIDIDIDCLDILIVKYETCKIDNTNCHIYYSWVSV